MQNENETCVCKYLVSHAEIMRLWHNMGWTRPLHHLVAQSVFTLFVVSCKTKQDVQMNSLHLYHTFLSQKWTNDAMMDKTAISLIDSQVTKKNAKNCTLVTCSEIKS